MTWHVVVNGEGTILAVYGAALLKVAQERAEALRAAFSCAADVRTLRRTDKPHVYETLA